MATYNTVFCKSSARTGHILVFMFFNWLLIHWLTNYLKKMEFLMKPLLQPSGQVAELANEIEDLLYEDESEDDEGKKGEITKDCEEEKELKSILMAVHLSWQRIGLMERRGFKVNSFSINGKCPLDFLHSSGT